MPQQPIFVQPQLYPISFTGGLDTKSDDKQVLAGNLLDLENGVFTNKGQISKRFGYTTLGNTIEGGGGQITAAQALTSYNDELVLFDGSNMFSYLESTGNWINRGTAISVIATDKRIMRNSSAQQLNPDVAYCDGIEVYAYEDSRGGVRYSVIDTETQAVIVNDASVNSSGAKPRCVAVPNQFVAIFYTVGTTLYYQMINTENPMLIQPQVAILTDGYASFSYDAVYSQTGKLYVAYLSTSTASGSIDIFDVFNFSFGPIKSAISHVENTAGRAINAGFSSAIDLCFDSSGSLWCSWSTGIDVRTAYVTNNLVVLLSRQVEAVQVQTLTGVESTTPTTLQLHYEVFNATASKSKVNIKTVNNSGTVTAFATVRSVGLASKAYTYSGNKYVNIAYQSTDQSTYFTLCTTTASSSIITKVLPGLGGGLRTNSMVSNVTQLDVLTDQFGHRDTIGIFKFANSIKGQILSEANTIFTILGVNSTSLDYTNPGIFTNTTQSNNLLIVGGVLQSYDGVSAVEHGFHLYPEGVTAAATGSDGFLSTGTYEYLVTYEWADNYGQIQRSAPSPAVTVSVTSLNHVTLTVPTCRLTAKQGKRTAPSIVIYRTPANGTVFNQVTSNIAPTLSDPTVDSITFVDTLSDATISSNALIYTSGGVLDNIAPSACSLISLFQNRVMLSGQEDQNLVTYSQNRFDNTNFNTLPAEFCAELTIGVDPKAGKITALGLLEDKFIIFKKSAIFLLQGDGPNAAGLGTTYPDPVFVPSDVGCTNPRSIVETPDGLMFQSGKGIYLLDRSLALTYIGSPVEKYNSLTVTSATLNPSTNQVFFTTNTGICLTYDYFYRQWSTFTNHYAIDATIFNGLFCYVDSKGIVHQQSTTDFHTAFYDDGAPIYMSWTSPNFGFAGLSGYQQVFRVYLLGTMKGISNLKIDVAYNSSPNYSQTAVVTPNPVSQFGIWGIDSPTWGDATPWGGTWTPYQFRVDFNIQKCTAIRIRVSDQNIDTSYTGESYAMSAMTFEVGVLPGGNRMPPSATFGTNNQ